MFRRVNPKCYTFSLADVCNRGIFQILLKKCKTLFIIFVIIYQFTLLLMLFANYNELYTLSNASLPDTFWHRYYGKPAVGVRRSANMSLASESVLVMACGRNVETAIPGFQRNVYAIVKPFRNYRILLGESDSTDGTLSTMQQWRANDTRVHLYAHGNLSQTFSFLRTQRIAVCRNSLLENARKNNWMKEARFIFMMDMDINRNSILTLTNVLTNFEYDTRDWAVMTASQTKRYYDIWALRSDVVNYDCWKVVGTFRNRELAAQKFIVVHTKPIPKDFGLIPVSSAFGGFGIYQTRYLNNCTYEGFDLIDREKCEHISFHECIVRNGGKIFINPRFQNSDGLDPGS